MLAWELFSCSSRFKKGPILLGYRNHIIADAQGKNFLSGNSLPADISEVHQTIPFVQKIKETFSLIIETVSGDAVYDVESILWFISRISELKPYPRNPRSTKILPIP